MRTLVLRLALALALSPLASACSDSDMGATANSIPPGTAATVTGPFANDPLAASVLWQVSSGSDYTYILGSGTSASGRVTIQIPLTTSASGSAALDPQALNATGDARLGVGYVVVTAPADAPAQAAKAKGDVEELKLKGISARYAYIFRQDDGETAYTKWAAAFPQGLSCGRCVQQVDTGSFDSYEPVDCGLVEIETAADLGELDVCNWT